MVVAVIGANGRTGRLVVQEALNRGWEVRALVRGRSQFLLEHPGLVRVVGDATNENDVASVLKGASVVINAAGPVKGGNRHLMELVAHLLAKQVASGSLARVVWLSGAGVKLSGDQPDFARTLVRGVMKLVAGSVLKDSEVGVRAVLRAGPAVTVVRVPMLTDLPTRGELKLSNIPPRPVAAGRLEVARLLLDQIEDTTWLGRAPFAVVN